MKIKEINAKTVGAIISRPQPIRNTKNNTGITLIALVVTIIVLLILAGVSLSLVAGSNGILSKAEKAVSATNEATILEEVELAISEGTMEYYLSDLSLTLNEFFAENFSPYKNGSGTQINFLVDGTVLYENKNGEITSLKMDANGQVVITGKDGSTVTRKVTYNANGGTGSVPAVQNIERNATVNVDFVTLPTRDGYQFLGWATSSNATTPHYSENGTKSFTMGTSNVTLYAVWQDVLIGADNYGDVANYSANGVDDWKVFLNDGSNIYLISSDYVQRDKINMTEDVDVGDGDYSVKGTSGDGLVGWLTTTSNWSEFAEGISGAIATGGATLEQFWASYNQKYETNYLEKEQWLNTHVGYNDTLYFPHTASWKACDAYWFASSSSSIANRVLMIDCYGHIYSGGYFYTGTGVRPLVCLPTGIKTIKEANGKWTFT